MARTFGLAAICAALAAPLQAGDGPDTGVLVAECEGADGVRVTGRLDESVRSLKFRASFGSVDIPLRSLARIEVADDRESTTLHFDNGDRLTGFPETEAITLVDETERRRIAFPELRRCDLKVVWALPAKTPFKVATARGSGSWNGHVPAHAVDGDHATYWNAGGYKGWFECDLGRREAIARVEFAILFSPAGPARYDVYASDEPMAGDRARARYVGRISGARADGDVVAIDCPRSLTARFVQIVAVDSVSWFAIREARILPPAADAPR